MKLLIIRHGQSSNNLLHATTGSFDGRSADPELTELGIAQCRALADAMVCGVQPAPQILYSSLMARAVQTAAVLADALDMTILGHAELYECGGPYQGSPADPRPYPGATASQLQAMSARLQLPAEASDAGWYFGDGEDDQARALRGARVIAQLRKAHFGSDVLVGVVCHEWISQYLIRAALDFHAKGGIAEPWLRLHNTATTLIDFEQPVPETEAFHGGSDLERVLVWHNNSVHLGGALIT